MIGRRAAVGLTLLCALLFSAFAAQSAMAVTKGTTAFTCVPEPNPTKETKGFKDAHCKEAVTGTEAKFVHKEIAQDLETIIHGTNAKTDSTTTKATNAVLKATVGGVPIEITCEEVFAHGKLFNRLDIRKKEAEEIKEHFIHGEKITVEYRKCTVTKPAKGGCKIPGEKIEAKEITATTTEKGDNITFTGEKENAKKEKEFVTITFEGCTTKGLNIEYPVTGSVTAQAEGATLVFAEDPITKANELKFGGFTAGLEGKLTLSQAEETAEAGKTGNPISVTTVET